MIFANDLVFKHLFESFDIGLQELRHFLHSESCHIGAIFNAFDGELLKLKYVIVLILELVQIYGVEFNAPSHFLFRLFDLSFISLVQDLEEDGRHVSRAIRGHQACA